jgi:hypothetical protein
MQTTVIFTNIHGQIMVDSHNKYPQIKILDTPTPFKNQELETRIIKLVEFDIKKNYYTTSGFYNRYNMLIPNGTCFFFKNISNLCCIAAVLMDLGANKKFTMKDAMTNIKYIDATTLKEPVYVVQHIEELEQTLQQRKKKHLAIGAGVGVGAPAIAYGLYEYGKRNNLWLHARQARSAAEVAWDPTDDTVYETAQDRMKDSDMGMFAIDSIRTKNKMSTKPKKEIDFELEERDEDIKGLFGSRKTKKPEKKETTKAKPKQKKKTTNKEKTVAKRTGFNGDFFGNE